MADFFDLFVTDIQFDPPHYAKVAPENIPVSFIDIDRLPPMDMDIPVRDNCPICEGNTMKVGDYVCWGVCYGCYKETDEFKKDGY